MSNATILVVDDEPQIRRVLQATLSSNGYDVIEAKNGREAITAVLREHPNLILLDVIMPGMSGFEACSKIRMFEIAFRASNCFRSLGTFMRSSCRTRSNGVPCACPQRAALPPRAYRCWASGCKYRSSLAS